MDKLDICLYIFNKEGKCIFSIRKDEDGEKTELIYGFLHTLKSFIHQISDKFKDSTEFITYSTDTYRFFVLELLTGYKIILIRSNAYSNSNYDYKQVLKKFYKEIYVEYVIKNPALKPGQEITSELFRENVNEYYRRLQSGRN